MLARSLTSMERFSSSILSLIFSTRPMIRERMTGGTSWRVSTL